MKQRISLLTSLAAVAAVLIFYSCKKDASDSSTSGKQEVTVFLNDDPSHDFTKVLVDIQYVEIKVDTSHNGHHDHDNDHDGDDDHHGHDQYGQWDTLGITPGIYDLLRLRNGVDTLLASGLVSQGRITKIRFTLGSNNAVWTDSTTSQPLTICDNRNYVYASLLTNSIDTLSNGQAIIRIDFDVERSIRRRNGQYCLQPYIHAYCRSRTGEIEGKVLPPGVITVIKAYNATDTAYAIPWFNGSYKIRGLNEGTYDILFDPLLPYLDTTITGVQVTRGHETHIPDVVLHQ